MGFEIPLSPFPPTIVYSLDYWRYSIVTHSQLIPACKGGKLSILRREAKTGSVVSSLYHTPADLVQNPGIHFMVAARSIVCWQRFGFEIRERALKWYIANRRRCVWGMLVC
ncbi:hypothetical protein CEXT_620111 [Caerostris extrusa]|uniref:Uncharacterized protein n=1 Tax=Caerostris extrusa TaxID=172846 RepID=A0AAV4W0U2_CAEEX|nr:hypothetical protein CEXT_620111 [Caerostris extrusa]